MSGVLDSIPGQLDEIKRRLENGESRRAEMARSLDAVNARLDAGDRRMHGIEFALAENTLVTREVAEATKDIREAVVAGRVAHRILTWAGSLAAACTALYLLWGQVTQDRAERRSHTAAPYAGPERRLPHDINPQPAAAGQHER